ncbi:MAG: ABC transporter ATP-binding protein [Tissierellia bacterium]|nr:ABC transporter ATP-binding protein [Tissierellia bacterium]
MRTFIKKISKIVNIDKKEYLYNQLLCFFCLITYTASSIIFPSFLSKIVDIGIAKNDFHAILKYSLEMLLCGVIMVIFYYYQRVFFFRFGNKIVLDTRKKIYEKLCNVNIFFWNKHKVGDILTILDSDLDKLQELLTSNISELIVNLILAIGIASYIIILNIKIGIFVIALAVIFAIIQKLISNKSKEEMRIFREIIGDFNSYSTETINNMMSLQMTGKVSYIKKTYSNKCNILSLRGLRLTKILSMVSVTGTSFNILAIILVLFIGALDVSDGLLSVGLLFSMTIYVQRLYSPIVTLGNLFVKIRNFSPILENIYDLVSNENIIVQGSYKSQLPLTGEIEFKKVSFSYNGEDYVIKNFSEHLNPGDIVGIVGENGSGDSDIMMTDTINPLKSKFKGFHKTFKQDDLGLSLSSFLLN